MDAADVEESGEGEEAQQQTFVAETEELKLLVAKMLVPGGAEPAQYNRTIAIVSARCAPRMSCLQFSIF